MFFEIIIVGRLCLAHNGVDIFDEFTAELLKRLLRPVAYPIDDTAIEKRGRGRRPAAELSCCGIHGEDNVQVTTYTGVKLRKNIFVARKRSTFDNHAVAACLQKF